MDTVVSGIDALVARSTMDTLGYQLEVTPLLLKKAIEKLADIEKRWFEQPQAEKEKFKFSRLGGYEGPNSKDGKRIDFKETFHYSIGFSKKLGRYKLSEIDMELFRATYTVMDLMRQNIRQFVHMLERQSGYKLVKRVMNSFDVWQLRLLHYFEGFTKPLLAESHPDKGFCTSVLYQSEEGHRNKSLDGKEWRDMHAGQDHLLMFGGLLLQLLTNHFFKGLCHQVQSNEITIKIGRWSIVLFIDIKGIYFNTYPHGRDKPKVSAQQQFGKAQNYLYKHGNLEHIKEFKKFFTKKVSL